MTDSPTADVRPGAALSEDVSFLLARASALSNAAGNAALAGPGLKVRSYSVLSLAAERSHPSQRDIADFLRLDPSQVVPLVDELQKAGLVTREADERDRRTNVIIATPAGRALLEKARASVLRATRALHSELSDAEHETLAELLRRAAFPA